MSGTGVFFDTNVLLYLLSADTAKADCAEALVAEGGVISVQVLNEIASVASRKLAMPWAEIGDLLNGVRSLCAVQALTVEVHERALALAERHGFAFYDASIVSSALLAGCKILWSEDFQHGLKVDGALTIRNPFLRTP